MSVAVEQKVKCYHCGDACESVPVLFDEKEFCCEGCKTVYEILNQNELCDYYNIEKHPGLTLKKPKSKSHFGYLDDEEIKNKILDFRSDTLEKVTFRIPQIHCASCVWLLENLYKLAPGVSVSQVNFMRKEAYIAFHPQTISLREVVEVMTSIGYEPEINLNDVEHSKPKKDRILIYRLGVAGFAFGNVMLLSFPEYLGLDSLKENDFYKYFGYWNLLLSLPVFFFSAWGYLDSAWKSMKQKQMHLDIPIALGIVALFGRSVFEIVSQTGAGYTDSLAGLIFFMLTGKWFQNHTYEQLSFERDYKSYFPVAVSKIENNGEEKNIPVSRIEAGDIIRIRHGEIIPADGVLLDEQAHIDYSFVTGESVPVRCAQGTLVYAGGRQTGSSITLKVNRKVSQSYLTRLWNHESFQKNNTKQLTSLANQVSQWFTPLILFIALVSGIYWGFTENWSKAALVFTAVLIVACPCALALSSPFTLGNAMRVLGKHKFYLKNTLAIESLAAVDHIVFDKTGTLTLNDESETEYSGIELSALEKLSIYELCRQSGHPVSKLIATNLKKQLSEQNILQLENYSENIGLGIEGAVNGMKIKIGSAKFFDLNENESSRTYVSIDGGVKGSFLFKPKYREQLSEVIQALKKDYQLSLISGDKDSDKAALTQKFGSDTPLHFNQSPHDKLAYIQNLQQQNHKVLMMGDGLNDAGALQKSDAGIAVSDNINNFSPACDAILDGAHFSRFPKILAYSKTAVNLVKAAFVISLLYNVVGVSFAVQGLLSPLVAAIIMPLSSISVVVFGTLSTRFAGKKLN